MESLLKALRSGASHLSLVHHETTAGVAWSERGAWAEQVINPLEEIVRKVKAEFPSVTGARIRCVALRGEIS